MKKIILLLLACVLVSGSCFAQDNKKKSRQEMWKELQEFKLKFLAQEMELDESQTQKFFDLYNQMSEEKGKIFKETISLERKLRKNPEATDADYEAVSKAITTAKEKDAAIEKKYDQQFSKFLSPKQIYKMKGAEEKFRQQMQKMRKNDRKKGHNHDRSKKR